MRISNLALPQLVDMGIRSVTRNLIVEAEGLVIPYLKQYSDLKNYHILAFLPFFLTIILYPGTQTSILLDFRPNLIDFRP